MHNVVCPQLGNAQVAIDAKKYSYISKKILKFWDQKQILFATTDRP